MKIQNEDTRAAGERKSALADALIKYQTEHANALRQCPGQFLDARYRWQVDALHGQLADAIAGALPIRTRSDPVAIIELERTMLLEFEDDMTGIHGARLTALDGVRDFLQLLSSD